MSGIQIAERAWGTLKLGGRITKYKGQVASYAPGLKRSVVSTLGPVLGRAAAIFGSSVSLRALFVRTFAVTLAAATPVTLTVTGAGAGACIPLGGGVFSCEDPVDAAYDETQYRSPPGGSALVVTTITGFGIDTSTDGGDAINLSNYDDNDSSITFTDNYNSIITGDNRGIYAGNYGYGETKITTTGVVTGNLDDGIHAYNYYYANKLTIVAQGDVTGNYEGIEAYNKGNGAISITTSGVVTGNTGDGIKAKNYYTYGIYAYATDLIINAQGDVSGKGYGIYAYNKGYGIGETKITTTGVVTGTNNDGIYAFSYDYGTSMTIDAQDTVKGGDAGIEARHNGDGALIIKTKAVTGYGDQGIYARNRNGTSLTITAQGTVTGNREGIRARNFGNGALSITTQAVTGGLNKDGIYANNKNGTSLTITANGAVEGGADGIDARNFGSAGLTITVNDDVDGNTGQGINAFNSANDVSASVLITQAANTITLGALNGILADNSGGSLTINALGTSIGQADDGIRAFNRAGNTTNLTITANVATGKDRGIYANNAGTGVLSITATGAITGGAGYDGIYARNNNGTSLSVTTQGAIVGGADGIDARNFGSAGLTITVNDDVDGNTGQGINAFNSANDVSASMLITQAANTITLGALNGILADNSGGSLTINALGTSIGQADDGIRAFNRAGNTTSLAITANVATGNDRGIYANNAGTGVLSITATGAITGGTSYGISALTGAGGTTQITLNTGAAVSSTSGLGIFNDAGNSTTTVNTGASVAGTIKLGDGSDNLNFTGGDFSAVTLFDGGDDSAVADTFIDTLTFAGSSGAVTGANLVNWENVVIGAGSTISFADNALTTGSLAINGGGILDASGSALVLTTDVTNNGIITMRNNTAGDRTTVTGNFTGTGELRLDVDFTTDAADTLVVNGNVTGGATTISVNDISTGTGSGNDILVVDVTGTSNAGDFVLGTPGIGAFSFTLAQIGNDFFLQQQAGFNPAAPTYEAMPQILLGLNTLSTLGQRATNRGGSNGAGIQPAGGKSDRYIPSSANYVNKQSGPIWVRLEGVRSSVDSAGSTTGSSYDVDQWKIRLGVDGLFQENDKGSWLVGLNAFYSLANTDISSTTGNGSIETKGFGLGLTTTWYGNDGYYVDGQAQLSRFSSDLRDVTSGALVSNNKSTGYAFGLEAGKRMATGTGWTITPQAQLIYSSIRSDSFTGPGATVVSLDDGDSLKGRVGFNLDQKRRWTAADGSAVNSRVYTLANIYYEFSDKSQVDISGVKFTSRPDRLSGEIGLGGSLNWNNGQYALFSEVSTATSLNNFGDSYQLKGTAGIRIRF